MKFTFKFQNEVIEGVKSYQFLGLYFSASGSFLYANKGKRKVQGVPLSQTAAPPRPQEEEETDKSKQAQTEQTYEKHQD